MTSTTPKLAAMAVLSAISFILGAVAAGPLSIALLVGRTRGGPGIVVYFLLVFIGFVLPGLLYIFIAFHIRRFKAWAVILGIVTATVHAAAALVVIVGAFVAMRYIGVFMIVPACSGAILLSAALWTIRQLTQTLHSLHEMSHDDRAAFTPIMND